MQQPLELIRQHMQLILLLLEWGDDLVGVDVHDEFVGVGDHVDVLFGYANDVRHEGLLGGLDELDGEVRRVHVAPFQW